MKIDFLTPSIERLQSDGSLESVHPGGALGRLRRPVVLIARDLCAFARFDTAALPRARRRQAARLHARVASPYVVSGAALVKAGADFGVWWWDLEQIGPMLAARYPRGIPSIRPETLAQPIGSDWRIVRLQNGYEAQLWSAGALLASAWRKVRFDGPAWTAFTRLQRGADDAPAAPPQAQSLPVAYDSEAFRPALTDISRAQAIGMAAAGFAVITCCTSLFFLGQGVGLQQRATDLELEAETLRAATPRASAVTASELDRQRLAAYQQVESQTNPLSAAGAAIGILALHDITPSVLNVGEDGLRVTLPYVTILDVDGLVQEFEDSGYFRDIEPRTDAANQTLVIQMQVIERASGSPAGG